MAFVLTCQIAIGNHLFDQVHQVEIEKSWKTLGDSATIKLPYEGWARSIKPGDPVSIRLGYMGKYDREEFTGYVSQVDETKPLEILCEDNIYLMKRVNIKASYSNINLKELVQNIVNEVNSKYPEAGIKLHSQIQDVQFEKFRLNNVTAANAMKKLREEYGLTSLFLGNQLYVGQAYTETPADLPTVNYSFQYNVIEHALKYHKAEDVRLKVKAINIRKDNTRTEIELGDEDGELRTLHFYNINNEAQLKLLAKEELQRLKFDGYEGDFLTFLIPFSEPGMAADIRDPQYPERSGKYFIDEVTTTFGINGARRKVKPGIKLTVS
jgi:hypothetical protein